jgi:hypothetical protein
MRKMILVGMLMVAACGDDGGGGNENEVITTVTLTFTPAGGAPVIASFRDPDGDGGMAPTIDPVNLTNATTYTLTVKFLNELETPAEDITVEVMDESDVHQLFFTGTAVKGPATSNTTGPLTHSYGDMDANGFPIGLTNTIAAATGTGMLTVTLRHMPPVSGNPVKTGTLADTVKTSGIPALPGDTDASVTFMATVP